MTPDLSELRAQLAPSYSHTGRPSIDPELLIRMLIVGYAYGIRSERRQIARSVHEDARDYARMLAQTEDFARSRRDRKKIEMVFAHMKRILGLRRFRLRGLSGAGDELTLAATVHNLRKLAKLIWRPPAMGGLCPA